MNALLTRLAEAKRQGYTVNFGNTSLEEVGITSPVFDHRGEPIAAVMASAPRFRVSLDQVPIIGEAVRECAERVTERLGGVPPAGSREAGSAHTPVSDPSFDLGTEQDPDPTAARIEAQPKTTSVPPAPQHAVRCVPLHPTGQRQGLGIPTSGHEALGEKLWSTRMTCCSMMGPRPGTPSPRRGGAMAKTGQHHEDQPRPPG